MSWSTSMGGILSMSSVGFLVGAVGLVVALTRGASWSPWAVVILISGLWMGARSSHRRKLRAMAAAVRETAAGDLTTQLPTSGEPGLEDLRAELVQMVEQQIALLARIEAVSRSLDTGWHEVNEVAWQMLETSEKAAGHASSTAEVARELSERIQLIAVATEEMTASVREVARNASEASTDATEASHRLEDANTTAENLDTAAQRVGGVVELIKSIADQTRLLALNATIEAARAGEHGRGFSVVADEVKQLAQQTTAATDNVSQIVFAMKDGSAHVAEVMESLNQTIGKVSGNQHAIAATVEQQSAATNEIGANAARAADGSNHLADNVADLVTGIRVTAYAGAKARTTASELAQLEKELAELVSRYRFRRPTTPIDDDTDTGSGVVVEGSVTSINNGVIGSGLNQVEYTGDWRHSKQNLEAEGSNSYSCMPGDTATLRFHGTRVRLFGFKEAQHGMAAVSIDDGPETIIDQYGPERACVLLYESPTLPRGDHTLCLRVTGQHNPKSRYIWVTVEHLEVDA